MRKSGFLFILLILILLSDLLLVNHVILRQRSYEQDKMLMRLVVGELGCSDLAVGTEARYTRHPAVSDGVVPFMDHPADIEHFPSGSFWHPVE